MSGEDKCWYVVMKALDGENLYGDIHDTEETCQILILTEK